MIAKALSAGFQRFIHLVVPHPGGVEAADGTVQSARYALWKNPENLTVKQQTKLAWVAKSHPRLHRAYLLKEGLRVAFQLKG